jgi:hypothetical protein
MVRNHIDKRFKPNCVIDFEPVKAVEPEIKKESEMRMLLDKPSAKQR